MSALDTLRAATTADITCKSGITYTIRPARFEDCLSYVGDIPMPVLEEIAAREKDDGPEEPKPKATLEQRKALAQINDAYVVVSTLAVGGEPVVPGELSASEFPEEDYEELLPYCTRSTPLPGKG